MFLAYHFPSVHAGMDMGRKRDETLKHDRLRAIMQTIVNQSGGKLLPVLRKAGIDVGTKEGRTAYQAINRWFGGREGKPGDLFPRSLKREYREFLFKHISYKHREEYIKPVPPGETWMTPDEMATWLRDYYESGQSGEPIQKWTEHASRVFNEMWGIENLDEHLKKPSKKKRQ
jgi:hypothetical protein